MPDARQSVMTVIIVALFLLLGLTVYSQVSETIPRNKQTTVTNETFTTSEGSFVALENDYLVEGSEVVYNSTGAEMTKGDDYEMDYEDGEIKDLTSGDLSDSSEAEVTYDYEHRWEASQTASDNIASGFDLMSILPIVLGATVILGLIINFGNFNR